MKANLDLVRQQEAQLLVPTYERVPVLFERGEGVYLFDSEGRRYVDFLSGIGVNALGHGHAAIQAAIASQAGRLIHVSNLFFHEYQARLAAKLAALSGLDRAFFCNSGTEAWECALKLARAYGRHTNANGSKPKSRLLVMTDSFHGRTMGSLATTGNKKYRAPFLPMLPGVTFVKFNDVHELESKFDSTVCAVGLETIQGEGGVNPVSREFLAKARALTKDAGALLILDEIQCGLGRTGAMFAYQRYGVVPDVVTVAKPLAAGLAAGRGLDDARGRGRLQARHARNNVRRRTARVCGGSRVPRRDREARDTRACPLDRRLLPRQVARAEGGSRRRRRCSR